MSQSRMPTSKPKWFRAAPRLTVTVDLPTPPLPLATPMIRVLDSATHRRVEGPAKELVPLLLGHLAHVDVDPLDAGQGLELCSHVVRDAGPAKGTRGSSARPSRAPRPRRLRPCPPC